MPQLPTMHSSHAKISCDDLSGSAPECRRQRTADMVYIIATLSAVVCLLASVV
ncbi:MAG: hypothetical protein KGK08_07915 [Acidobacteriota bacterium]|nr:hypothetical protein [Acidobacteriota bacterium]